MVYPRFRLIPLCLAVDVGGPTMAMMALKCPDIKVTVVDINDARCGVSSPAPDAALGL